jgi:hypothetical protein
MHLARLLTLLAALLLCAPSHAQTIKSLGYNTTNGFVVYSGTNPLTFTNSLQFATNARAATRTNLGGTSVGDAVFTATNAAAGATALELGATNNVTFNNLTTSGTLTATGNVTMSGTANTAPNQTAASSSSLLTRSLGDQRYNHILWLTQITDNQSITNGGLKLLGPSRVNSWSVGYGANVPPEFTRFRVILNYGWMANAEATNFAFFVRFNNQSALSSTTQESEHVSVATATVYPSNGLTGANTKVGTFGATTNSVFRFASDWVTIPSGWQSNAATNQAYHVIGATIQNNSGVSLTDGFNANHAAVGHIEFSR